MADAAGLYFSLRSLQDVNDSKQRAHVADAIGDGALSAGASSAHAVASKDEVAAPSHEAATPALRPAPPAAPTGPATTAAAPAGEAAPKTKKAKKAGGGPPGDDTEDVELDPDAPPVSLGRVWAKTAPEWPFIVQGAIGAIIGGALQVRDTGLGGRHCRCRDNQGLPARALQPLFALIFADMITILFEVRSPSSSSSSDAWQPWQPLLLPLL